MLFIKIVCLQLNIWGEMKDFSNEDRFNIQLRLKSVNRGWKSFMVFDFCIDFDDYFFFWKQIWEYEFNILKIYVFLMLYLVLYNKNFYNKD